MKTDVTAITLNGSVQLEVKVASVSVCLESIQQISNNELWCFRKRPSRVSP